ncbi:MAG: ATPase, YjeE family protein [candidate division TM6 bacterium GW2011_GWF2_38_10]|nr:MAG: ATPase, YjeE family protein [candidate division TM6 bacterium GW2011_GWF2_38_10]
MKIYKNQLDTFIKNIIIPLTKHYSIITLSGDLGAGKTTLMGKIMKTLGIKQAVTSPTFGYVKTYTTPNNLTIHHFDLYRLSSIDEFFDAGFDEYIVQPNSISFIEWPEIIAPLLSQKPHMLNTLQIIISHIIDEPNARFFTIKTPSI